MDAGDIWASVEFAMPGGSKSSVYRTEVADAAAGGGAAGRDPVRDRPVPARAAGLRPNGRHRRPAAAVPPGRPDDRLAGRNHRGGAGQAARGRLQPRRAGHDRRHRVLPVRRAPGRRAARPARGRSWPGGTARSAGPPRTARSGSRSCAGVRRPAARRPSSCPPPSRSAHSWHGVPQVPAPLTLPPGRRTYRQISYRESGGVGYLEFTFPGGAMSTGQCRRLLAAYRHAQAPPGQGDRARRRPGTSSATAST